MMNDKLEQLQKYLEKMEQFNHVNTLLYWDMRTNTPKEGFAGHSDALTYFSTEQFSMSTSDELKTLLDTLAEPEEFEKLDDKWKFVVNKMKTDMDRNRRIPKEFYESFVKAQSESENAWEEAKEKADFSVFAPHLQKMIDMTAEMTGYTDPEKEVYDALLDQYEKGMVDITKNHAGIFHPHGFILSHNIYAVTRCFRRMFQVMTAITIVKAITRATIPCGVNFPPRNSPNFASSPESFSFFAIFMGTRQIIIQTAHKIHNTFMPYLKITAPKNISTGGYWK